ncbi:MAG: HEAT repeat domain-containing protein [Saprospiraceae bacterium]
MSVQEIVNDKTLKQKAKVEQLAKLLTAKKLTVDNLIAFAEKSADTERATCIEALEFATRQKPDIADEKCLKYVSKKLTDEAPRVKWESAKVIGNIAHLYPTKLNTAIVNLLTNSEYSGTVVRWAAAFALGEILKLKTKHNKDLLPAIQAISKREQDNAIKKKYLDALKKVKK